MKGEPTRVLGFQCVVTNCRANVVTKPTICVSKDDDLPALRQTLEFRSTLPPKGGSKAGSTGRIGWSMCNQDSAAERGRVKADKDMSRGESSNRTMSLLEKQGSAAPVRIWQTFAEPESTPEVSSLVCGSMQEEVSGVG